MRSEVKILQKGDVVGVADEVCVCGGSRVTMEGGSDGEKRRQSLTSPFVLS